MKRGLITWDRNEIAPEIFDARVGTMRALARGALVPAVVIYSDVWRSNQARFVSNFMPYFNRSLLVVPVDDDPILICGLSPRVYPWIRSVTNVDDIRPGKWPAKRLVELAADNGWSRVGAIAFAEFPYELASELVSGPVDIVDVEPPPSVDDAELAMRRRALAIVRPVVDALERRAGDDDCRVASRLERDLRRLGMEDLVLWFSQNGRSPRPASGTVLGERFSVSVAAEYRGHWVSVSRSYGTSSNRDRFEAYLESPSSNETVYAYDLGGAHPFRAVSPRSLVPGSIAALHLELADGTLYGDTCLITAPTSASVL